MLSSPPPQEHIKKKETDQFSQKTETGDWHKDSYITKAVKKDPHRVRKEGKRSDQVGTHT